MSCSVGGAVSAQLRESPNTVAWSNVQRSFPADFNLELSETMLGHSKLSELFRDRHFDDICSVLLEAHGYVVVERAAMTSEIVDAVYAMGDSETSGFNSAKKSRFILQKRMKSPIDLVSVQRHAHSTRVVCSQQRRI